MRLAVVADVHGNLRALEAVAADLKRHAPDLVINLGDCVSGPLEASATADLLMDLGWPTVRGNHDRWVVEKPRSAMGKSDLHAAVQLDPRHQLWLGALPSRIDPLPGVAAFHATPADDDRYLTEEVYERGDVLRPMARILHDLQGVEARLILVGHTHIPRVLALADGRVVLNPGSVGCPAYEDTTPFPHVMETGSPHARYALVDFNSARGASILQICVEYDWKGAAETARAAGREDWAHALATGYARIR